MEAQIAALKRELGEDMDWTALENVLEGEWDEAEWERVVGTMLNEAADKVSRLIGPPRICADESGGRGQACLRRLGRRGVR